MNSLGNQKNLNRMIQINSISQNKSRKSKSNVPTWSNADYVNTTSEETKAELESKKQEMLSRLDNSEVQTDIYDYLD